MPDVEGALERAALYRHSEHVEGRPCGTCDLQALAQEVRDLRIWKETQPMKLLILPREEIEAYDEDVTARGQRHEDPVV